MSFLTTRHRQVPAGINLHLMADQEAGFHQLCTGAVLIHQVQIGVF